MRQKSSRRKFVRSLAAAGAVADGSKLIAQQSGSVKGFDHVALPMKNTEAMSAFYRSLGFPVSERPNILSVYVGTQMINFHLPALWQDKAFTLRAPAAEPPCGDVCFVWDGTMDAAKEMLARIGAKIVEGPVPRQGGRKQTASSVYVRDPDGNLLEFMVY